MNLSPLLSPINATLGEVRRGTRIGAGDSARPAVIAALTQQAPGATLVIVPRASRAHDLAEELGHWLGPDAASRIRVYPQRDALPYERVAEDPWDVRARLDVLSALHATSEPGGYRANAAMPRGSARGMAALSQAGPAMPGVSTPGTPTPGTPSPIIIASIEATAQRTLSPEAARAAVSRIAVRHRVEPDGLLRGLQASGFEIVNLVEAPGQAARRGGIVDVFPPQAELPARIEFFGAEVESIRLFDVDTQRSRDRVDAIGLGAASEVSPDASLAAELASRLDFSACDEATEERLREELEDLARGVLPPGPAFLPALLSPYSLLDHVPDGALVLLDEPMDLSRALDEYVAETATMRIEREARGQLPIGLPAAQANWTDLQPVLERHGAIELLRFATPDTPPGAPVPDRELPGGHSQAVVRSPSPSYEEGRVLPGRTEERSPNAGGFNPRYTSPPTLRPPFAPAPGFGGRVRALASELADRTRHGESIVIVSQQASRLNTLLADEGLPVRHLSDSDAPTLEPGVIQLLRGSLPHGWTLRPGGEAFLMPGVSTPGTAQPGLLFLTDAEVFGFVKQRRALRQAGPDRSNLVADLSPGDYVVHLEHGIARFAGLIVREVEGVEREFLELTYAEGDRLFVPVDQSDRVARYVGPGDYHPGLTRLGSGEWSRARERVRRAVADVARDLLDLYASRQVLDGHAFSSDTPWQQELDASFPYVETPDQVAAISAVKEDMERPRPMDRLICGDVGFGKTEVAIRAAFKAVMDGYQVAILVPTTVLAQQHYNTFKERLASLPARVEMLSRFLSDKEQRDVVQEVAAGSVDILIGTHRILQRDVGFKQLGLVIIDEEQRFGVAHKERLKQMRTEVDVLTLSATPIPRTLHMSLVGIRDLSNMMTAPEDRSPIRTYVLESDDQIIREAIRRELERGGQVFFVHNRVYNIELVAARIRKLVPEAEIGIGHGQMHEDQLERTMLAFAHGEIDVLVCTTIIESGLDIPNANTIIINQADRLGLAQLYQLRGRVGRSTVRAYAYLLYDRGHALSEVAQRRLQAVFEATELGAGMQIALRDLEIRGAGNLLGAEQSGHMAAVGFDLYVRLLGEAVERLKALDRGETPPPPTSSRPAVTLDLPLTAYLPTPYIPDLNLRLAVYQRLSQAADDAEAAAIENELRDRFGELPVAARNLLWVLRLRLLAMQAGVGAIQAEGDDFVIRLLPGLSLDREAVSRRAPPNTTVLSHQLRMNRDLIGEGWRETIVRALAAITPAEAVA